MTVFSLLPPVVQILIIGVLATFGSWCFATVLRAVFRPHGHEVGMVVDTPYRPSPDPEQEELWRQYFQLSPRFHQALGRDCLIYHADSQDCYTHLYFAVRGGRMIWKMEGQDRWYDAAIPPGLYFAFRGERGERAERGERGVKEL